MEMFQLVEIARRFPEVEFFNITQDNKSGIGHNTTVSFSLFGSLERDTTIDITDVSTW